MLICFDYDGVLADTFAPLLNICKDAQQRIGAGREPLEEDFREAENLTFTAVAKQLGIPDSHAGKFAEEVFAGLGNTTDVLFDGIASVLTELSRSHTLCVVTANSAPKVTATLTDAGVMDCFSAVFTGEANIDKAEQITQACARFQIAQTKTIMVGDTLGDIRMAKRACVHSIAVTWGFQDRSVLVRAAPDHFAETPNDLLAIARTIDASQPEQQD